MVANRQRILVPLDGSSVSEGILPTARLLATALKAELVILGVGAPGGDSGMDKVYLGLMVQKLVDDGFEAFGHFRTGKPAAEILEFAGRGNITVIALSTHGRSGLSRLLTGSVAESVLRKAEVPVVVARPGARAGAIRRIAVALDGSARAEEVLPDAVSLAKELGASLDLVRVAVPVVAGGGMGEIPMVFPGEDLSAYLGAVSARLAAEGVMALAVAPEGQAAAEILRHAAQADLLCMTSHGRTGVPRVLFGSIAEEVLRNAPCPVWVRRMAVIPAAAGAAASATGA